MRSRRPHLLAPLAGSLLLLGACSDPAPVASDPEPSRATDGAGPTPQEPTGSAAAPPSDDNSSDGRTVPVYFVGDTERAGPRLYREFQRVEGDPLPAALALLTTGDALDPDYRTLFPGGSFAGVSVEDGLIVVTLADDGWLTRAPGMTAAQARLAVQQLVRTVQGVQQERLPVEVRLGDEAVPLFGVETSGGVSASPELDVLSHMSITAPEQGATVTGDTLRATGVGNGFEASVGWRILRGDEVVDQGAGQMEGWLEPRLFPWDLEVDVSDLAPGEYTFWVTTDDPTGGTEGVGAMTDDREFVVE